MSEPESSASWSGRDLLVLYAGLTMGTSMADIAASLNRSVGEVIEKAAALKSHARDSDAQHHST
jgi:hypothetical protein